MNEGTLYYRLVKNYNQNFLYPLSESPYKHIDNYQIPWFTSCFSYNENHKKTFEQSKSFSGIKDNTTNKLWWDFDSENDVEKALVDSRILYKRIQTTFPGINMAKDVQVSYSGYKGIGIVIKTNNNFTQSEVERVCKHYAKDLPTFDSGMYDHQRIFRLPSTKHEKSGLYKICLSEEQFLNLSLEEIKELAIDPTDQEQYIRKEIYTWVPSLLPPKEEPKLKLVSNVTSNIDWMNKPKWLSNCRWMLQNGQFKLGERSNALLCLGSTYKNQGFSEEIVKGMLLGVAEKQAATNNCDVFPENEIDNNIIKQLYNENWRNGQFSCKDESSWLHKFCISLGDLSCRQENKEEPITIDQVKDSFKNYVVNIDKNTIKTGIKEFDDNVFISTGANVGVLGSAGSGKSTFALNVLNYNSKIGVPTVFASLDMHKNRMYEKVLYKVSGLKRKELYKLFQEGKEQPLLEKVKKEFGNVYFFNKSCPTVGDLKQYILECQAKRGEKIKLVMVDYFERVMSDFSDENQSSKRVAGELQDLVNDLDIALITLVQPNKNALSGGVDKPIYDYTAIKGSSYLYQSFRIITSINRPFATVKDKDKDHYMNMIVIKNDLGDMHEFVLGWNGAKGEIYSLDDSKKREYDELLREKQEREEHDKELNGSWS